MLHLDLQLKLKESKLVLCCKMLSKTMPIIKKVGFLFHLFFLVMTLFFNSDFLYSFCQIIFWSISWLVFFPYYMLLETLLIAIGMWVSKWNTAFLLWKQTVLWEIEKSWFLLALSVMWSIFFKLKAIFRLNWKCTLSRKCVLGVFLLFSLWVVILDCAFKVCFLLVTVVELICMQKSTCVNVKFTLSWIFAAIHRFLLTT